MSPPRLTWSATIAFARPLAQHKPGACPSHKRRPLGPPGSTRAILGLSLEADLQEEAGGTAAWGGWPRVDTPAERVGPPSNQNARGELGCLFAREDQ